MKKLLQAAALPLALCLLSANIYSQKAPQQKAAALNEKPAAREMPAGTGAKKPAARKGRRKKSGAGNKKAEALLAEACKTDISRFCGSVEPGLRQGNCLMRNETGLSTGCVKALKSLPEPPEARLMKACKNDITKFCKDVEPGLEQGKCLKSNEKTLSTDCGKVLKSLPPPEEGGGPEGAGPERGGPPGAGPGRGGSGRAGPRGKGGN